VKAVLTRERSPAIGDSRVSARGSSEGLQVDMSRAQGDGKRQGALLSLLLEYWVAVFFEMSVETLERETECVPSVHSVPEGT